MRLAIDKNEDGYQPQAIAKLATVTLDGVVQDCCLIADEEGGYVTRYVAKRKVIGFSNVGSKVKTERKYGKVVITWPEGFDRQRLKGESVSRMNNGSSMEFLHEANNDVRFITIDEASSFKTADILYGGARGGGKTFEKACADYKLALEVGSAQARKQVQEYRDKFGHNTPDELKDDSK